MAKTSTSTLSLEQLVGLIILEAILIWASRIHSFFRSLVIRSKPTSSRIHDKKQLTTSSIKARGDAYNNPDLVGREEVETVMGKIGMSLNREEILGLDDLSDMFEEKEPSLEEVKEAFSVFDDNRDGFIDAEELQRVLCNLGFRQGEDLDACSNMIAKYDDNRDGRIDFHEFVRFMESSFC